ncbi:MAG: FAD-binding oxidoreductase [Myxococcales bacterium]|jgi:glycolate oxidase|nr:MAG: FAD-binding oxidoreductase [Myxococcales bacterium]
MPDATAILADFEPIVGTGHVLVGEAISDDYAHDEALTATPTMPLAVVRPGTAQEVAALLKLADEKRIPVTARGAGTGLSGACIPRADGIVVSLERMNRILEVDEENSVAVVEPGVRLDQLDEELRERGLVYPVYPGEYSASLGGNVSTNAGGMRAVKYGVTRQNVLGIEAVLVSGEIIESGGKFIKGSTGYDLTQLIIGSEGTLAIVTKAYLRLCHRPEHGATVLAPFATLEEVTAAIPKVVASGVGPLMLEYIDLMTMAAMTDQLDLKLGVRDDIREKALAYLVVALENTSKERLDEDTVTVGEQLAAFGALDVYVLQPRAATEIIEARERAFWLAKGNGANDVIDVVVPRAAIAAFMKRVAEISQETQSLIVGCGHAGDGNVHMAIFQPDEGLRSRALKGLFQTGIGLGGAISGEHGIGKEKKSYYLELEDPTKIALMRGIKATFDPNGILNPGTVFD